MTSTNTPKQHPVGTRPATAEERGYTPEQIEANRRTHVFKQGRCRNCDCRTVGFSVVADSPCGDEPPRITEYMPCAGDDCRWCHPGIAMLGRSDRDQF